MKIFLPYQPLRKNELERQDRPLIKQYWTNILAKIACLNAILYTSGQSHRYNRIGVFRKPLLFRSLGMGKFFPNCPNDIYLVLFLRRLTAGE